MTNVKKILKMIRPGQLIHTKYYITFDKLSAPVGKYPHDGIISEVGDNIDSIKVIHFTNKDPECTEDDGANNKDGLYVRRTSLRYFLKNSSVKDTEIEAKQSVFLPETVVNRAESLLGTSDYDLKKRNCQSFASHCYFGKADSPAVRCVARWIASSILLGACIVAFSILGASELYSRTPFETMS